MTVLNAREGKATHSKRIDFQVRVKILLAKKGPHPWVPFHLKPYET